MSDLLETLQQEGVDPALLEAVQQYRAAHALPDALRPRIPSPAFTYYGKQVWEQRWRRCSAVKPAAGRRKATGKKTCWPKTLLPPLAVLRGTSPSM